MKVAVILPCYRSKEHVLRVINAMGVDIDLIIAVDDKCPEQTGEYLTRHCKDPRLAVLFHETNQGVGGAVITGIKHALQSKCDIFVKVDSDGQMDPLNIPKLIRPIVQQKADYTKGNRFYSRAFLKGMPKKRLFGNAVLSFITKFSSGYWNVMDPTNGFVAIHRACCAEIEFSRVSRRYFFESDMLHHLYMAKAVVQDVPLKAIYGDETSNLHISKIWFEFLSKNIRNTLRRLFYTYLLRDFSIGSTYLIFALVFLIVGGSIGSYAWIQSIVSGIPATSGTVMLAGLPIIVGVQSFSNFINYDIFSIPKHPLSQFQ